MVFLLSRRGGSPVLSSVNGGERRNCRDSAEWHCSSLFSQRLCCYPSHNIPAFYGLKWRVRQRKKTHERRQGLFIFPLSQMYPECVIGCVWLPRNSTGGNVLNHPHNQDLSRSLLNQIDPPSLQKHHSIHASLSHWHPLQCFCRRDARSVPVHLARLGLYTQS